MNEEMLMGGLDDMGLQQDMAPMGDEMMEESIDPMGQEDITDTQEPEQFVYIEDELIEDFGLPKYIKGKTFAEASELIDKKFKDRKDRQSVETKEEMLTRLAEAQEYIKEQEQARAEAMEANAMEVPDLMDGAVPPGADEFMEDDMDPDMEGIDSMGGEIPMEETGVPMASGGFPLGSGDNSFAMPEINTTIDPDLNNYNDPNTPMRGLKSGEVPKMHKFGGFLDKFGGANSASDFLGTGVNLLQGFGGDKSIDPNSSQKMRSQDIGSSAFGSAIEGGLAGLSTGNPFAAAGGLALGALSGIFGAKKNNKKIEEINNRYDHSVNSQYTNDFILGGKANISRLPQSRAPLSLYNPGYVNPLTNPSSFNPTDYTFKGGENNIKTSPNKFNIKDWFNNKGASLGSEALRLAPIAYNALTKINRPQTDRGTRLSNRYERSPMDVESVARGIRGNNVNKAVSEMSGGDLGAARANMLGANYNLNKAISDAYTKAHQINMQENQAAQQFNLGVNHANMAQDERFIERRDKDLGAYNTAKHARNRQLAEDIGKFGKERSDEITARNITGYTRQGKYWVDEKGNRITDAEYKAIVGMLGSSPTYFNPADYHAYHYAQAAAYAQAQADAKKNAGK